MYSSETNGIRITVTPSYLDDQSNADTSMFVWAYSVGITNGTTKSVQLLSRQWFITDANGKTIVVEGAGVVGEQPLLEPGDRFEYTSGTPLNTPTGFMRGYYTFVEVETGHRFQAEIPAFSLDNPNNPAVVH